ncbi:MAG: RNA polymerase sigma-70 factor [Proteiniphilum sp.]|jgi:RNA polymerase sigma-70 factor (ECF subfamily)|nr:RNA polymerase sigma-70 factor [Proteiniphilum sp.]
MRQIEDEQLLEMMVKGSEKAFEELYIRYKKKLHSFCCFLLKSANVAEDVVQEVFMTVWHNREKINTHQSFSSYLYTITRNKALNELRSERFTERLDEISEGQQLFFSEDNPEAIVILKEYEILLQQAIDLLPEEKRRIYRMSREDGLTYKDIGECLGISPHTVQAHISSSVQFIRSYFLQHANVSLLAFSSILLYNL